MFFYQSSQNKCTHTKWRRSKTVLLSPGTRVHMVTSITHMETRDITWHRSLSNLTIKATGQNLFYVFIIQCHVSDQNVSKCTQVLINLAFVWLLQFLTSFDLLLKLRTIPFFPWGNTAASSLVTVLFCRIMTYPWPWSWKELFFSHAL